MIHGGSRAAGFLLLGDVAAFALSLWIALALRSNAFPSAEMYTAHLLPFSVLFLAFIAVFYIAGLYGKGAILLKSRWPDAILRAASANVILAALFFSFVPGLAIAPKTVLVIYLLVSLATIALWRLVLYPRLSVPRTRYRAALIATGKEADELHEEVNGNPRYALSFAAFVPPETEAAECARLLEEAGVEVVVTDVRDADAEKLLLTLVERGLRIERLSFDEVYEEVFDRVPLCSLDERWFLEHAASMPFFYAILKRMLDIVVALGMGIATLLIMVPVSILHRLEGKGELFISQSRIGLNGTPIRVYKFRSMRRNDAASGSWVSEHADNAVTRVGAFLRKTSLDEFPQFLNILRGELSIVGPRSDIAGLAARLGEALPYYARRYLIRPGITGWAQINQQYEPGNISPQSIEETKTRLAYDFYYLAHRSLGLDLVIIAKTVKTLLGRVVG